MLKPANFIAAYCTTSTAPYQIISSPSDLPERGSSNGGVFHRGQIVWTQESPAHNSLSHAAVGFVEGLGHVLIDHRLLRPAALHPTSANN